MTLLAIEQFIPCLVGGRSLTAISSASHPEQRGCCPASGRDVQPRRFRIAQAFAAGDLLVGVFYMLAGSGNLAMAAGRPAFSPWADGIAFGVGRRWWRDPVLETGAARWLGKFI